MPIVKDPHFCQPPIWPWLYRKGTVWQCPRCKTNFKLVINYGKEWRQLPPESK